MLHIPYYLHGNWKLNKDELQALEKNLLVKENCKEVGLYTTYDTDNKHLSFLKGFYQNIVDEIAKTGKPVEGFHIERTGDIGTIMKASKKAQ